MIRGRKGRAILAVVGVSAACALLADSPGGKSGIPFSETPYVLGDEPQAYVSFLMSGGPPPDGIPSIDAPHFVDAPEARLAPGDLVIGFAHGGEAVAYPHAVLVYHEIVNDRVGGVNVAITYCPLTATALGFLRGEATLGVSGQLLNSNLVMFDRETGSYFSQIAAIGLTGPASGRGLQEVQLFWTTWERWQAAHPNTKVLSERTGYLRNYARDPYGTYNPVGGYYAQDGTLFPVMHSDPRHHPKEMVLGARTAERSTYFVLEDLAREGVRETEHFLAVHDPELHTGFVYETDGAAPAVGRSADGLYVIDGEAYRPDELPMRQVVAVTGFFFAWHAFYPESERVVGGVE